ncbi:MAG: peroxide stress protein YaaA [Gammaproteobacteria bacterium]|nr:peroxide stress protein YaaA [Gammaproteobacteria bacterium]
MLVTLSPSKGQDFDTPTPSDIHSIPDQLKDSQLLIKEAKKLDIKDVRELMDVSENISILNVERFNTWEIPFTTENAKPALFAFKGDVYSGIQKEKYSDGDLTYAQDHLRILSGLYGALRPMDLIQPYRLEMKTKLRNPRGENLYQFWDERITEKLNETLEDHEEKVLVNLASNEYFKSVKVKELDAEIITPAFKEFKNGDYKMIGIYAKKARGLLSRYIIQNKLSDPEDIKSFSEDGYRYNKKLSKGSNWVFTRKQ